MVRLNGKIGLVTNGAGTGMASMDFLDYCLLGPNKLESSFKSACSAFIDTGAYVYRDNMQYTIQLLLEDPQTTCIYFNFWCEAAQHALLRIADVIKYFVV